VTGKGTVICRLDLLGITLLILTGCAKPDAERLDHPRLVANVGSRDVVFYSKAVGRQMRYRVILPLSVPTNGHLPVVYLLHGGGGDFRDWSNYSDVARFAGAGLVLVMPQGDYSYYLNAVQPHENRYEDYIVHDLVSDVETKFAVASHRADRSIVGVSMGGFGAIKITLSHPDLFNFVGALSPAIDVARRPFSIKRFQQYRALAAIFGPWGSRSRRDNDPFVLVQSVNRAAAPYVFLSCGEGEGLLPANRQFAAILQARQLAHEFHVVPGGHDWNQWNNELPKVFESLQRHISHDANSVVVPPHL